MRSDGFRRWIGGSLRCSGQLWAPACLVQGREASVCSAVPARSLGPSTCSSPEESRPRGARGITRAECRPVHTNLGIFQSHRIRVPPAASKSAATVTHRTIGVRAERKLPNHVPVRDHLPSKEQPLSNRVRVPVRVGNDQRPGWRRRCARPGPTTGSINLVYRCEPSSSLAFKAASRSRRRRGLRRPTRDPRRAER